MEAGKDRHKLYNTQPRTLVQICEQDERGFAKELNGNVYCGINITRAGVSCPYRAFREDHNGLYRCGHLRYMKCDVRYVQ